MNTRDELAIKLTDAFDQLASWFEAQPDGNFESGPEGKWTAGQHLDHLTRSAKPLNLGMRAPRVALKLQFGTANRPSMPYEDLVAKYEAALADGGAASGQFLPNTPAADKKASLLKAFRKEGDRLVRVTQKWSEPDLDRYVAPHPLLGKLTMRELLCFTVHHTHHHLNALRASY